MASALLDRAEAAERLNVSQMTVRRLGRDGCLEEIRVGKRAVRITLDSIERHLASRRISHDTEGASAA